MNLDKIKKRWRWIDKHANEYNGWLMPSPNGDNVYRYKAYLPDGYKAEIEDSLDNINKSIGNIFYKDVIRDENIKKLGL